MSIHNHTVCHESGIQTHHNTFFSLSTAFILVEIVKISLHAICSASNISILPVSIYDIVSVVYSEEYFIEIINHRINPA